MIRSVTSRLAVNGNQQLIANVAESLLTEMVANVSVDDILLSAQATLGTTLRDRLQALLAERYDAGVLIHSVSFTQATPPREVADAFSDVIKARNDKQKRINDAESYAARIARQTQARVEESLNKAHAYATRREAEGQSQAQRFTDLLAAYRASAVPEGVRRRLLLEAMERVLPRLKTKVIVGTDSEPVDLGIWQTTPK